MKAMLMVLLFRIVFDEAASRSVSNPYSAINNDKEYRKRLKMKRRQASAFGHRSAQIPSWINPPRDKSGFGSECCNEGCDYEERAETALEHGQDWVTNTLCELSHHEQKVCICLRKDGSQFDCYNYCCDETGIQCNERGTESKCVSNLKICDGVDDCGNGKDEQDCGTDVTAPTSNIPLEGNDIELVPWLDQKRIGSDYDGNLWNDDGFGPASGFRRQTTDSKPFILTGQLPKKVWYRFPQRLVIVQFGFRNRRENGYRQNDILDFDFIGSPNCKDWTVITSINGVQWTNNDEEKSWTVTDEDARIFRWLMENSYFCYGFQIRRISGQNVAGIQDIKMWRLKGSKGNERTKPPVPDSVATEPPLTDCTCDKDDETIDKEEPTCPEYQKAFLRPMTCGCSNWVCVWTDCAHFNFSKDNPIECDSCAEVPLEVEDCGCAKWECRRRPCEGPENEKIEECPSKCDEVKVEEDCGCTKYSCDVRPPPDPECSEEKPCVNTCQECTTVPWISETCSEKTGFNQSICVHKKCPPQDDCGECQIRDTETDGCGCPKVTCLPKPLVDKCVDESGKSRCTECEECVLHPSPECAQGEGGVKICERKECPTPTPAETCSIDDCLVSNTTKDECGCVSGECITPPDEGSCECNECQECTPEPICQSGNRQASRYKCEPKKPPAQECGECEEYFLTKECDADVQRCRPKTCSDLPTPPPPCPDPCDEPSLVDNGPCGCKVYECAPKPTTNPEEPPSSCNRKCANCERCEWIRNEQCGTWDSACVRKCKPRPEVGNRICFGPDTFDECECPKPLAPKPCVELFSGKCPEGSFKKTTTDVCGCDHDNTCEPCEELDPKTCNECERPVYWTIDGCRRGKCDRKDCVIEDLTCEPCEEKNVTINDCKCPEFKCVTKSCPPPKECIEGEKKVLETSDVCGCPVVVCEYDEPCEPDGNCRKKKCPAEEVCEECEEKAFFLK